MAPRKRKKKQIDEGPFLFSEEEMLGMISNVAIIEATVSEKTDVPLAPESSDEVPHAPEIIVEEPLNVHNDIQTEAEYESELVHVSVLPLEELSTDERIVQAMTNVLWQMRDMDKSQIRRIAFSITGMSQQGVELNRSYSAPVIQDDDISGYELAAWCYCTFVSAFPSMLDKLQLPYADHYAKAKANIG